MADSIPANVGERTSPQLFGMFFNYGLMGALIVQVYQYYCAFPRDSKITKIAVYTLFVLELAQTGMMSHYAYKIFGAGYGDMSVLNDPSLAWFPADILPSVTVAIAQTFYAQRIYRFLGSKVAGGIVSVLALIQCAAGMAQGVFLKLEGHQHDLSWRPPPTILWLTVAGISNLAIAAFMTVHYLRQGRRKDAAPTFRMNIFVRYTIETGAITALLTLCQIFIQCGFPRQAFFKTGVWTLGKLHSNTLLALLNSRAMTVGGRDYQVAPPPEGTVAQLDFPHNSDSWLTTTRDTTPAQTQLAAGELDDQVNNKPPSVENPPVIQPQSEISVV
ncbi:hypothetical protein FB45DRAFT_934942 [Roridomyces roridus]|uniref:DUF6534 domain-containing protein n=1 Tax=Roridomyces roridus TaxID=1738132 RepID=A0AAD7BBE3_9AGAR|nr:hypothetical protein FB45DRAFT_934942 [Roridomyces roridus]